MKQKQVVVRAQLSAEQFTTRYPVRQFAKALRYYHTLQAAGMKATIRIETKQSKRRKLASLDFTGSNELHTTDYDIPAVWRKQHGA
jgi:hypothetical protein